ncbi:translation initiation factor IF-2-like [Hyaena hyaena]|uniref:translation initiation factor IF-2-like n=1 Tax=Hyaena hyaena TaxID=95912 RepID=UPI0019224D12|nr:translation initiation factor IF-2-like [Hyaena hyaena]
MGPRGSQVKVLACGDHRLTGETVTQGSSPGELERGTVAPTLRATSSFQRPLPQEALLSQTSSPWEPFRITRSRPYRPPYSPARVVKTDHPAPIPGSAGTPHPQPQVAGGGSERSASRPGLRITPRPAPGGLPGPPPRRAEEGREPGGGAGGRVVPGCHFLPPPRSLRGARPPPPPPLPAGRAGSRSFRVGVRALQRPGRRPQAGPRGGGRARKAEAARPGPLRQRRAGHHALAPRAPGAELQGSGSVPRAGHCPPPCPPPGLPSSPPASGPASRAARSGAHYRVAGGVGPARLRALASARCSPPAAALAPAPALRSRPGRQRRLGGPGAPRRRRAGPPQRPDPALGLGTSPPPRSGPLRRGPCCSPPPRGVPRYLALPLRWVPASSTGRRDSGPSSPWAGVSASPQQPVEPPAAFTLQFSRPPPEPTALCLPQHWGWGQQRRPISTAIPTRPATPARCRRRRVEARPLNRAKVGGPGPSRPP